MSQERDVAAGGRRRRGGGGRRGLRGRERAPAPLRAGLTARRLHRPGEGGEEGKKFVTFMTEDFFIILPLFILFALRIYLFTFQVDLTLIGRNTNSPNNTSSSGSVSDLH